MAKYLKACFHGNEKLETVVGAFYIPKDNQLSPLGQDALFICKEKQTIGVADGVGGWSFQGVEAGDYSRVLMNNSVIALHDEPKRKVNPKRVLRKAYSNTKVEGSSTVCIVTIIGCQLHAVNVGDSGFILFRDKELVYKSPVQHHWFNSAYQLGYRSAIDTPRMCKEIKHEVKAGDIVVLGTDGLFDNMYATEIEEVLKEATKEGVRPEQLARIIAETALSKSQEKDRISPFAKAAQEAGSYHIGGKKDDITVIVVYIESKKA